MAKNAGRSSALPVLHFYSLSTLNEREPMVKKSFASSPPAGRIVRSDEISPEVMALEIAESMVRLSEMTDDDIDYSDIPQLDESFWANAQPNPYAKILKEQVTVRIDGDVLAWFRDNHEKYQTAINQALREHMERTRQAS
jgi:uncharacterized protein (DUF4415 family)